MAHDKHKYFCKVDTNYLNDNFNLYGLRETMPYFRAVHNVVKGYYESGNRRYHSEAERLYGMIHARYILTNKGLGEMLKKFRDRQFGNCRNAACEDFPLLPIGLHADHGVGKVKLYCRCCEAVFRPARSSKIKSMDGSYWGPTFPHLFFVNFGEKELPLNIYRKLMSRVPTQITRKVYGFKVYEHSGPGGVLYPEGGRPGGARSDRRQGAASSSVADRHRVELQVLRTEKEKLARANRMLRKTVRDLEAEVARAVHDSTSASVSTVGDDQRSLEAKLHEIGEENTKLKRKLQEVSGGRSLGHSPNKAARTSAKSSLASVGTETTRP
jgi:casein kinase II subunit beta